MLKMSLNGVDWSGGIAPEYERVSGRELYEARSITGLNRMPVTILSGFVLSGAVVTGNIPFKLEELAESLMVDGSTFVLNGKIEGDIIYSDQHKIIQQFENREVNSTEQTITRVYSHKNGKWTMVDYAHYGTEAQMKVERRTVPNGAIVYVYNAVSPSGILEPVQDVYHRIEEIMRTVRSWQTGASTKTIVSGHVRDRDGAAAAMQGDDQVVFFPGDISVNRAGNTATVDQLTSEYGTLLPLWQQLTHYVDVTSPVQRPSGADRQLVMAPMRRYIDSVKGQITDVLAMYGAAWSSDRLHTTDVNERLLELSLLRELKNDNVIDQSVFTDQAQKLI